MVNNINTHAGYIAILGRPNVGKSTLLNRILGRKISITADKAQTTRHKVLGIKTIGNYQAVYVDTPGIHKRSGNNKLNVYMNQEALSTFNDVDAIIFMVVGTIWQEEDDFILAALAKITAPVILAINKVDLVLQKERLLSYIERIKACRQFAAIVPLSADKGTNVEALEQEVKKVLPQSPFFFPIDQSTDRDDKFLAAEIIREKLTRCLGQELPYSVSVMIERIETKKEVLSIAAVIYVERRGQKIIVIGKGGEVLKKIGTMARRDLEDLFGRKVFLQLWVKVKTKWTSDDKLLKQMGYGG